MAEGPRERCDASSTSGASLIRCREVGLTWAAGAWTSFLIDREDCRPAAGGETWRTRTSRRGDAVGDPLTAGRAALSRCGMPVGRPPSSRPYSPGLRRCRYRREFLTTATPAELYQSVGELVG